MNHYSSWLTQTANLQWPSLKLTSSPLKMDGWKMIFLGLRLFSGVKFVRFRECFRWNQHKIKNKTNPNPYQFKLWFPKINTFDGLCFFCSYLKPKKRWTNKKQIKKEHFSIPQSRLEHGALPLHVFFGSSSSFYLNWNAIFYKWQVDFIFFKICFVCLHLLYVLLFFSGKNLSPTPSPNLGVTQGVSMGTPGKFQPPKKRRNFTSWILLVVSTHLKNTSQNGNLPPSRVKIWNHHLV